MTSQKCLVIDPMHESLFPMLKEIGWESDYQPNITRAEIKNIHHHYDGLIVRTKTTIDHDLLGDHPTLKFIGRAGAGLDNLQLDFLAAKGIHVLHASEGNRDAVGEFAVGILLSLLRNIPKANTEVGQLIWDREGNRGEELMGKTIGIIGYGNMGQAFAKRLSGFGCRILAYDKYKISFSDSFCTEVDMKTLFAETDILSLHIPLTDETRLLVETHYLKQFQKKIILINTARGEIVSLASLVTALDEGYMRGAALDVLENERLGTLSPVQQAVFNTLCKKPNVLFTPHIAGWTFESHIKINVTLVQKIKALHLELR